MTQSTDGTPQSNPLAVSVVIPMYNRRDLIGRTLDSVLAQTYRDFELIVVDDGSTDGAGDVVRQYKDPRVRLIAQPNGGECAARNRGIAEARGDWIGLLDSDDEWLPGFLEAVVSVAAAHPALVAVFTNLHVASDNATLLDAAAAEPCVIDDYLAFAARHAGHGMSSSSVLLRKAAIESVGGFPAGIHRSGDVDTWFRLALIGSVGFVPEALAVFHNETKGSATLFPKPYYPQAVLTLRKLRAEKRIPERFLAGLPRLESLFLLQYAEGMAGYGDYATAGRTLFRECSWRHCPPPRVAKLLVKLLLHRAWRSP